VKMSDQIYNRLMHMLEASKAAVKHLSRKKRKDLDTNRTILSAVVRELEIIGEAANSIPMAIQNKYPQIPWRQMIAMRNRLIHAYFDVDHDIVWVTATQRLPLLIPELEMILKSWN
jgi:uncharacterized protein with HEPN domain